MYFKKMCIILFLVCVFCLQRSAGGVGCLGTEVTDHWKPPSRCLELNLDPLAGQQVAETILKAWEAHFERKEFESIQNCLPLRQFASFLSIRYYKKKA